MSQTIASDMIQRSFDVVSEEMQESKSVPADKMQGILSGCQFGWTILEEAWQLIRNTIDQGTERTCLIVLIRNYLAALERGIEVFGRAKELTTGSSLSPQEKKATLGKLEELVKDSSEMRTRLQTLQQWLNTPRPTVSLSSLPDDEGDPDHKGYIDLQALVNQFSQ